MFGRYKCIKITILITLVILSLITAIIIFGKNKIVLKSEENLKKSEIIKDINFEPYSNENGLIILVTIEDSENGISDISYKINDDKMQKINAYNKRKVSIDCKIEKDGEYKFTAYNSIGEKIEKTLVIDSVNEENNTLQKLIDIKIEPIIEEGRTLATKADVVIDYNYGFGNNYYKIGNQTTWNEYSDVFQIDSYAIINDSLQESDNKTVTVYAKKQDIANNKIIIKKQNAQLDFDIPEKPQINIIQVPDYATLTSRGIRIPSVFEAVFDDREDITNYYSLDKGITWNEYTGQVIGDYNYYAHVKSVKNCSGLEIQEKKIILTKATNSLSTLCYDEETSTGTSPKTHKLDIDNSMWGEDIQIYLKWHWNNGECSLKFYDSSNNLLKSFTTQDGNSTGTGWKNFTIPENSTYVNIYSNGLNGRVYEIVVNNIPKIEVDKFYPIITNNGVDKGYSIVRINYFSTSEQRLYKIDEGDWQNYKNESIKLIEGQIIYAKGIDKNGIETILTTTYTSTLSNDALPSLIYDDNISTGTAGNYRLNIDETMWGEDIQIYLKWHWNNGECSLKFYDSSNNLLKSFTTQDGHSTGTGWKDFTIPENSTYVNIYSNRLSGRVYEIKVNDT